MIRLPIPAAKIKQYLTRLNINTVAWTASVSLILAVNLSIILVNSKIKEYQAARGAKDKMIIETVQSLDSLKREFNQVINDYAVKNAIDFNTFNQNLKDISVQLAIQNKKINILSTYLTGHQAEIQKDFQDLQSSINDIIRIYKEDSLSIKVKPIKKL